MRTGRPARRTRRTAELDQTPVEPRERIERLAGPLTALADRLSTGSTAGPAWALAHEQLTRLAAELTMPEPEPGRVHRLCCALRTAPDEVDESISRPY